MFGVEQIRSTLKLSKKFTMFGSRVFLPVVVILLLSACALDPEKLYDGPKRPDKDTSAIVAHRGASLYVDGWDSSIYTASVLPGDHRIVVVSPNVVGYVELDAKARRSYSARTIRVEGRARAWAVDLETCDVVAGVPPDNFNEMNPVDKGCTDIKPAPAQTAANVAGGVVLIGGALFITGGHPEAFGALGPVSIGDTACPEKCYSEPDAQKQPFATLLFPPWLGQAVGDCDAVWYWSSRRCLTGVHVDGLPTQKNTRILMLDVGHHELVYSAYGTLGRFRTRNYTVIDGLSFKTEPGRVYALCVSRRTDDHKMMTWIADNETGQVVAGRESEFDAKEVSTYSRYCPAY